MNVLCLCLFQGLELVILVPEGSFENPAKNLAPHSTYIYRKPSPINIYTTKELMNSVGLLEIAAGAFVPRSNVFRFKPI